MIFNLNFDPKLLRSAVDALVQLAADYRAVHREEIAQDDWQQQRRQMPEAAKGRVFYQSDRKLHEEELKERLKREAELGTSG